MKIRVNIPLATALAAGCEPGKHDVEVALADLSPDDRALLAAHLAENPVGTFAVRNHALLVPGSYSQDTAVPIAPAAPTAEAILDALRAVGPALDARRAALRLRAEQWLADLRADTMARPYADDTLATLFPDLDLPGEVAASERRLHAAAVARGTPEADRLRAQGRLDLGPQGIVTLSDGNPGPEADLRIALGDEYQKLYDAAQAEQDRRKAAARAADDAARDAWLAANGGQSLLTKIGAGYDCAGAVRAHVRAEAAAKVLAVLQDVPGIRVLDESDESESWKSRTCPSDAAFAVQTALQKAGFEARVRWAIWPAEDADSGDDADDAANEAEIVTVVVPIPWDPAGSFGSLELTAPAFSD
jgi:hypothetical protein